MGKGKMFEMETEEILKDTFQRLLEVETKSRDTENLDKVNVEKDTVLEGKRFQTAGLTQLVGTNITVRSRSGGNCEQKERQTPVPWDEKCWASYQYYAVLTQDAKDKQSGRPISGGKKCLRRGICSFRAR